MRIGVLGIFHSASLTVASGQDAELVVSSGSRRIFVRPRSSCSIAAIRAMGDMLLVRCGPKEIRSPECHAAGRNQQAMELVLAIPGKIKRKYEGTLDLKARNGEIIPVVEMDLEIAVASVVQAEAMPETAPEALKAPGGCQPVVPGCGPRPARRFRFQRPDALPVSSRGARGR